MSRAPSPVVVLSLLLAALGCGAPFDVRSGLARSPGAVGVVLAIEAGAAGPVDFVLNAGEQAHALHCEDGTSCLMYVDVQPEQLDGATVCRATDRGCVRLSPPTASLPSPTSISARALDGAVGARWAPTPHATHYRIELWDSDSGARLAGPIETAAGEVHVALSQAAENLSISVEAVQFAPRGPVASARALAPVSSTATADARWRLLGPADFVDGVLELTQPSLGADERLAVLVLNVGGPDGLAVTAGLGAVPSLASGGPSVSAEHHALARTSANDEGAAIARLAHRALEQKAAGDTVALRGDSPRTSFCVLRDLDPERAVRRPAILVARSRTASWYVDVDERAQYPTGTIDRLARTWEEQIAPRLTEALGAPSDVDQNGELAVFLTGAMGAQHGGYFNPSDLSRQRDRSSGCGDGASNGGEVLYLNSLANSAPPVAEMLGSYYPSTLAHELAHLVHFARRCLERTCRAAEEAWIAEGIAKTAEDAAGFGWHVAGWRAAAAGYLRGEYTRRSLTQWEGDTIGNYEQTHSFFRFFADRRGPSFLRAVMESTEAGAGSVERALGVPFARAIAEWTTALWVSNETWSPAPRFDYLGDAWAPLHERVGALSPVELEATGHALAVRRDGFAALLAPAGADKVRLTTRGPAPYVVLMPVPTSAETTTTAAAAP